MFYSQDYMSEPFGSGRNVSRTSSGRGSNLEQRQGFLINRVLALAILTTSGRHTQPRSRLGRLLRGA